MLLVDIDYIFLSHFVHPDHSNDLIGLFFILHHKDLLSLINYSRAEPIVLFCGKGFKEFYKKLIEAFNGRVDAGDKLVVKEMDEEEINFEDLNIKVINVKHEKESRAFKIEQKKKTIVYSGDTGYTEELKERLGNFARNADLFILECAIPDKYPPEAHLNPTHVGKIAEKANPKKLLLTHFYPPTEKEDIKGIIKNRYDGRILLAEDFMEIEV